MIVVTALCLAAGSALLAGCTRDSDLLLRLDQEKETREAIRDRTARQHAVRQGGAEAVRTVWDAERGRVLSFSGGDAYLRIAKSPDLDLQKGFTLSVWLKVESFDRQLPVLEWEKEGWGTHLWLNVHGYQWQHGPAGINLCIAGAGPENVVSTANPEPNRWSHVAVTYDARQHVCRVFMNHELKVTSTVPMGAVPTLTDLIVGARPEMKNDARFKGLMDDIRVFRRPLTPEEIKAL